MDIGTLIIIIMEFLNTDTNTDPDQCQVARPENKTQTGCNYAMLSTMKVFYESILFTYES